MSDKTPAIPMIAAPDITAASSPSPRPRAARRAPNRSLEQEPHQDGDSQASPKQRLRSKLSQASVAVEAMKPSAPEPEALPPKKTVARLRRAVTRPGAEQTVQPKEESPAPAEAKPESARRGRPPQKRNSPPVNEPLPEPALPLREEARAVPPERPRKPAPAEAPESASIAQEPGRDRPPHPPQSYYPEQRRDFQNRSDRPERYDRPPRVDFNDRQDRAPGQGRGERPSPPERQERRPRFDQPQPGGRQERFNRQGRRPDPRGDFRPEARPFSREPREPREFREPRGDASQQRPEPLPLSPPEPGEGLFELAPRGGYGYVRQKSYQFAINTTDPYVSPEMIRKYQLRDGHWLNIQQRRNHRGYQAVEVTQINGEEPEKYQDLPAFEELKAVNPNKRFALETAADRLTTRMIDLLTPIGRGQRGLIVAPPRTGKTTFLRHIAEAVQTNYAESVHLMVLLVDERPEEVTEFQRSLPGVEIWASSNDNDVKSHIRMAELAINRAKRFVEAGKHVFMLMDSITRLARAFNNSGKGSGRTMKGGVDIGALEIPRRLFAAARNTRTAGSLTIIATALIETNSAADELIYQEFKGTGNMELVLDRRMAEQYVYPAIDIFRSGSRREELLLPAHMLEKIHVIRRGLSGHKPLEAIERLNQIMGKFPNNPQMLMEIKAAKA